MSNVSLLGTYGDGSGSSLMFRNKLINGGFHIAQRTAGATNNNYAIDRFIVNAAGTALTWAKAAGGGISTSQGSTYATSLLQLSGAAGNTDSNVTQRIEAVNCADLTGKIVTFSVWILQSTGSAKNISIGLSYANAVDNWGSSTTISVSPTTSVPSGTWTQVLYTTTLPTSNVSNGIAVVINTGAIGSGATVYLANAQLEAGNVATPFEQRPVGLELSLCQRYYQTNFPGKGTYCADTTTSCSMRIPLMVTLRVSATPTQKAGTALTQSIEKIGQAYYTPTSVAFSSNATTCIINFTGSFTQYQPCGLNQDIFEISAEL